MITRTSFSDFVDPRKLVNRGLLTASVFALCLASACSKSSGDGSGDGAGGLTDADLALGGSERFGGGNIPGAEAGGALQDIHFAYNSSEIEPEYQDILKKNASLLSGDSSLKAEIEGHCDKRGTSEYNLALGEERAKAVARLMVSFGARPEQLTTISYGEEIPLDSRDAEDAYALNRRAHFALSRRGSQG